MANRKFLIPVAALVASLNAQGMPEERPDLSKSLGDVKASSVSNLFGSDPFSFTLKSAGNDERQLMVGHSSHSSHGSHGSHGSHQSHSSGGW